ncbi:MAG: hypothetical protein C0393_04685 [Anaerolinea sp.]|nr:hypothetical protein [Anaerolinea sp.]
MDILRRVASGMHYKEIGIQMNLSERTVRYSVDEIRKRLGLTDRAGLIDYTIRAGLVKR